jgi:hypothetical protein
VSPGENGLTQESPPRGIRFLLPDPAYFFPSKEKSIKTGWVKSGILKIAFLVGYDRKNILACVPTSGGARVCWGRELFAWVTCAFWFLFVEWL